MAETNDFWEFYWETRLLPMENLGKRAAILAGSKLIRVMAEQTKRPLRLLELGCGEGQVIGMLIDAHSQLCQVHESVGVDYNPRSLARARQDYHGVRWIEADFTDGDFLAGLGKFDIVLLVNAIHEVFSATYSDELGEVDVPVAKQRVEQALAGAAGLLAPGRCLILFDGLEPPGDPCQKLRLRFLTDQARNDFEVFVRQYHPFRIVPHETGQSGTLELSRRDFTRYITKSIFLGKLLWATERFESYQYFTEEEFRAAFTRLGLKIAEMSTLTVNGEKWRSRVEIDPPETEFPQEHILIVARLSSPGIL